MRDAAEIATGIKTGAPEILAAWWEARGEDLDEEGPGARLAEEVGRLLVVFAEFLGSPAPLEGFSREGATRALVAEISALQRELGRDAVGVMEDYAALRRCVWRFVDREADLSALDGSEVSRFFVKLMQASDWVTENGLAAFDEVSRRDMEGALGWAAATDLLTGLPDRELFNRVLLPRALEEYDRLALVVFDVADFSETVAAGEVERAREALLDLADAVGEIAPEGTVRARFGDDEVCAILAETGPEGAYGLAEGVLERLTQIPGGLLRADAGVAGYPEHGRDAGELVVAAFNALKTAKRVGGGGIVVAR